MAVRSTGEGVSVSPRTTRDRVASALTASLPWTSFLAADKTMGTGVYEGKTLERWQYEVTSGGRIFYLVDDPTAGGRRRDQVLTRQLLQLGHHKIEPH